VSGFITEYGYLDRLDGYLDGDNYLGGEITNGQPFQVRLVISAEKTLAAQVNRSITPPESPLGFQTLRHVSTTTDRLSQLRRMIADYKQAFGAQALLAPSGTVSRKMRVKRGRIKHTINAETLYLEGDYLEEDYLAPGLMAWLPTQVFRRISTSKDLGLQVLRRIVDQKHTVNMQTQRRIDAVHPVGFQVNMIKVQFALWQIKRILYNTKRLRILAEFPSRGLTGTNWTATSTAAGDFSVNNLNTDIVEQAWRSSGAKIVTLTCDTEISQGVFVDTIGILGHNLTRSATIEVQYSNQQSFATYQSFFMKGNRTQNWYYVAPKAPTASYRFWRFLVADQTNTAAYLQIGSIVFGSSVIMTANDITDNVRRTTRHFADKVATEGFTAVSNDRAVKYGLGLEFQSIAYAGDDYENLRGVFDSARTSHKCLWIPTPEYAERFAVFGKLTAIPEESHNALGPDNDYIAMTLEVDESL
jgi:hypothetical protein